MRLLIRLFTSFALVFVAGCTSIPPRCGVEPLPVAIRALDIAPLSAVPQRDADREARARQLFELAGCDTFTTQQLPRSSRSNIICEVKGHSPDQILIGAHYDKLGPGDGVADNWTGIVLVANLIRHFREQKPDHTLRFVAFAEEEAGLIGSRAYARQIRQGQTARPVAMINIDTIGVGHLTMERKGSPFLRCVAQQVADQRDVHLRHKRLSESESDWEPFHRMGIPVLHFHSLDSRTLKLMHTRRDARKLVDDDLLRDAYQVIAHTLSAVDQAGSIRLR